MDTKIQLMPMEDLLKKEIEKEVQSIAHIHDHLSSYKYSDSLNSHFLRKMEKIKYE